MTVVMRKGQFINGIWVPSNFSISGLSPDQEAILIQGGDAVAVVDSGGRRILKAATSGYRLTGGVAGVKTTMLAVDLPDGWLADPKVRLIVEYGVAYTNSANVKNYGIDIGADAGSALSLRTQAPTTTASETTAFVMQRDLLVPSRFRIVLPNNYRTFGSAPGAGATVGALANAGINPDATGQKLFFWGQINPTSEFIDFEHIFVALDRAEN